MDTQGNPLDFMDEVKRQRGISAAPDTVTQGWLNEVQTQRERMAGTPQSQDIQINEGGLDEPMMRMSLALDENLKEMNNTFSGKYPQGSIAVKTIRGEPRLVFRREKEDQWTEVDPGIGQEGIGVDLADLAGDVPEILGEIGAMIRSRGLSIPQTMARLFAGGFGGHTVEELGEMAAGTQENTAGEAFGQSLLEGVIAGVGGVATTPITGAYNVARGRGLASPSPEGAAAMISGQRLGLPELMPQQVSRSPILQKMAGQAGATLPSITNYFVDQQKALVAAFRSLREKSTTSSLSLGAALKVALDERTKRLNRLVSSPTTSKIAGDRLKEGLDEWDNLARTNVNELYARAREIERPTFDLDNALDVAKTVATGRPFATLRGGVSRADEPLSSNVKDVIKKLREFDPDAEDLVIDGVTHSQTDALLALREQLYLLKTPELGKPLTRENMDALKLYDALTRTINGAKGSPEFVAAWGRATTAAADRFKLWDKAIVKEISASDSPSGIVSKLLTPGAGNVENLELLKKILPAKRWDAVTSYFETELLQHGSQIGKHLDGFDKSTLNAVMPPERQKLWRRIADGIGELEDFGITETLKRMKTEAQQTRFIIETATPQDMAKLLSQYPMGTPQRKRLRAGLIDTIVEDGVKYNTSGKIVMFNPETIEQTMKNLRKSGANKILTPSDWRNLRDLVRYARSSRQGADTGTSIQAAESVAGLRRFDASAFHTVLQHFGFGSLMTSKAGHKLFFGSGRSPNFKRAQGRVLKTLGANIATVAAEIKDLSEKEN